MTTFAEYAEHYAKQFARYTLEPEPIGSTGLLAFRLQPPGGGLMEGVVLLFPNVRGAANITIITGDLAPNDNQGCISNGGYGLEWFAKARGTLSDGSLFRDDTLASKFLRKVWVPEDAIEGMRERLKLLEEDTPPLAHAKIEALREALAQDEDQSPARSADAFTEWFMETFDNESPETIGFGYEPRDAALLCTIQRIFSRLYTEARR